MSSKGYIKFYRSTLKHPFFRRSEMSEMEAWLWLLSHAAWKPHKARVGDFFVELERGEVLAAVRHLAMEWRWSKGKVERFVTRLKNEGMVGTRSGTGVTVISISKYNEYQGDEDESGTPVDGESGQVRDKSGTSPGRERDASGDNIRKIKQLRREEGEEGNKKEEAVVADSPAPASSWDETFNQVPAIADKPKKQQRQKAQKSHLPQNWTLPEDYREYARSKSVPDNRICIEAEKFKNYYLAHGKPMVDWLATWRNWILRNIASPQGGGYQPRPSKAESAAEGISAYFNALLEQQNEQSREVPALEYDGSEGRQISGD